MSGFEFRINMLFAQLKHWVFLAIMYYVWKLVIESGDDTYSLNEIMTYYGIVRIAWQMTSPYDFKLITGMIKSGELNNLLIKPLSPIFYYVFDRLGYTIVYWLINSLSIIAFWLVFGITPVLPQNIIYFLLSLILLLAARLCVVLFYYSLSSSAFWITETKHIHHLLINMVKILGGSFIPLIMLPRWIQFIANFLPFKYAINYPVNFYLGRLDVQAALTGGGILLLWIIGLFISGNILWRIGLRRYEATGS